MINNHGINVNIILLIITLYGGPLKGIYIALGSIVLIASF